ncbi:MGMT family protein [Candidatus Roizmanbacteria bacterium]|jgi:methylated-DNA-[protein]-cysteine S-methyltransferase|nr:MGMT family protein [Candidatus Roizmanbacteria bacterium]
MDSLKNRVYKLLKQVPLGKITTYKLLAEASGTKAYRAIGQILKNNPYAPQVPCHRVVKNDGTVGGFMGKTSGKTVAKKIRMLVNEGIIFNGKKIVDFDKVVFADFKII